MRKITLLIASLFITIGAMAQVEKLEAYNVLTTFGEHQAASNAVDGSHDTFYWSNQAPTAGATFTVALRNRSTVNDIKLYFANDDRVAAATIEISNDGITWTEVGRFENGTAIDSYTCNANGTVAGLVRMKVLAPNENKWFKLKEFEIYGTSSTDNTMLDIYTVVAENYSSTAYPSITRPAWAANNDGTNFVSTGNTAIANETQKNFAFVYFEGKTYIYSVAAEKFVMKNNSLASTLTPDSVTIEALNDGKYFFKFDNNHVINIGGSGQMVIDSWGTKDGGNKLTLTDVGDFDAAELLEMLAHKYTIIYNYKENGELLASTQHIVSPGSEYPALISGLHNVTINTARPSGTVTADDTVDVDVTVGTMPFEYVKTGIPTKWYYVQMHGNFASWLISKGVGNTMDWKVNGNLITSFTVANADAASWAFVGNAVAGFKMVNKAGGEICSTGSGNATVADAGTAFQVKMPQQTDNAHANDGFCMLNAAAGEYINAQTVGINHWSANDAGSTMWLTERKEYDATVTAAGYSTLYLDYAAYVPEGVEVYYINNSTIKAGGYIDITQVEGTTIPANQGFILKKEGNYNFIRSTENVTIEGNLLHGTTRDDAITKEDGKEYYILSNKIEPIGFYIAGNGGDNTTFKNNANKAYLVLDKEVAQGSASLRFDFGGTTGVEEVEVENDVKVIYDLQGRRVNEITEKGIYIVNGNKVLVK